MKKLPIALAVSCAAGTLAWFNHLLDPLHLSERTYYLHELNGMALNICFLLCPVLFVAWLAACIRHRAARPTLWLRVLPALSCAAFAVLTWWCAGITTTFTTCAYADITKQAAGQRYYFIVGECRIPVTKEQYDAVQPGQSPEGHPAEYPLYGLEYQSRERPGWSRLLSLEIDDLKDLEDMP